MGRPTRVAMYARVSTTGHGQDPELQLGELRQVAQQRGWSVAGEYVDEGISGAKASRPALDRMLADAREGRVDVVAIWKLDRLARSVAHLLEITDSLNTWGVGLVSIRDAHVDTTTAAGRFTLQILGAVAELERSLIRERVIAGVRRAQAQGKHCGRPPVEIDLRPAVAMLDQGHSLSTTSTALGLCRATLRKRLLAAGEWPRQGGGNKSPAVGPP